MFDGRCEREEGSVMQATFTLAGQTFMCVDSAAKHDSSFTPSMSLFVDCADEAEIDDMFAKLSDGGQVFMPLNSYPFSRKFGCQSDKYGVSWQLNLPLRPPPATPGRPTRQAMKSLCRSMRFAYLVRR